MKKLLFLSVALMLAGVAAAQPRVQFGLRAGIFSQDLELNAADFEGRTYLTNARLGFNAAIVSRVRLTAIGSGILGLGLFLQPEIVYSQNACKMQPKGGKVSKIRMQSIEIPVLLSAKVSIVRLQAGPVFNVMYKNNLLRGDITILPNRPTMGYTVGASVDLFGGITLDGRYSGQFKDLKNHIKAGETVHNSVRGSLSSWSVGLSFLL